MNRIYQHWFLLGACVGFVASGCGFFTNPQEAETFGELQISIRFAEANAPSAYGETTGDQQNPGTIRLPAGLTKKSEQATPAAIDRLVVVILEHSELQGPGQELERALIRRELPLGSKPKVQTVIQVPLRRDALNCFRLLVQAFQQTTLLYSGQDFPCFDEQNKRVAASILLEPVAFHLDFRPANFDTFAQRMVQFSGQVQDTAVTRVEIIADSVQTNIPLQGMFFNNPVMLFGDTTLVRVRVFGDNEFRGEVSRRLIYTGASSDILVALVWNQPINVDLEILNPLQQLITPASPGDREEGNGRIIQSDQDGFGPEVYEWRDALKLRGNFLVSVRRPPNVAASGRVYVFIREGQRLLERRQTLTFDFQPLDRETVRTFDPITWPPL